MDRSIKEKMRAIFPGAAEWQIESEALRLTLAEMTMSMYRGEEIPDADHLAFLEYGYASSREYWEYRLSEPIKWEHFVSILSNHLGKNLPSDVEPDNAIRTCLELARDVGEAFVTERSGIVTHPIDAARWLLSLPLRRHLVPPTLASFLRGENDISDRPKLSLVEHEPRKRGPKTDKVGKVAVAMKSLVQEGMLSPGALRDSTEKDLERRFAASRDTVRKARDIALSEIVEDRNSDNPPANDK